MPGTGERLAFNHAELVWRRRWRRRPLDDSSGGGDGIDGKSERTKVRSHGTPGSLGPALVEAHSPSPTCNSDLGSSHASFMLHVKILYLVPLPCLSRF